MFYLRDAEDDLENLGGGTEEKSEELYLTLLIALRRSCLGCEVYWVLRSDHLVISL